MKTHRQELTEKLDNEFGKTVNATQVTIKHLLLLCDMFDERETNHLRDATKMIDESPRVKHANGYDLFMAIRKALVSLGFEIKQPGSVNWGTVEAMLNDAIFVDEPTQKAAPTNEAQTFPDELVERLHQAYFDAMRMAPRRDKHGVLTVDPKIGIRAILVELAKTPYELPTEDDLYTLWAKDQRWQLVIRAQLTPILAAKDARIADLETKLAAAEHSIEWGRQEMIAASIELGFSGSTIEEAARKKNKAHDEDKMRIAELEAGRATDQGVINSLRSGITDHANVNASLNGINTELHKKIADLEKRIAELTAPMAVDGKTPGQFAKESFYNILAFHTDGAPTDSLWECAAKAVLRAFGNGAEALKRVRELLKSKAFPSHDGSITVRDMETVIDAEIAKLA